MYFRDQSATQEDDQGNVDDFYQIGFSFRDISIAAGSVSGSVTWPFNFYADNKAEGTEDFRFEWGNSQVAGYSLSPNPNVYITDPDSALNLSIDADGGTTGVQPLREGESLSGAVGVAAFSAGSSTIGSATSVVLSAGLGAPGAGVASAVDFTYAPASPNTVSVAANSVSGSAALGGLAVVDDGVVEGPETFVLSGVVTGVAGVSAADSSVTIVDDDADIDLTVSESSVLEGAGEQAITVRAAFRGSSSVLTAATDVTVTLASAASGGAVLSSAVCPQTSGDVCSDKTNNQFTVSHPGGRHQRVGDVAADRPGRRQRGGGRGAGVVGDGVGGGRGGGGGVRGD